MRQLLLLRGRCGYVLMFPLLVSIVVLHNCSVHEIKVGLNRFMVIHNELGRVVGRTGHILVASLVARDVAKGVPVVVVAVVVVMVVVVILSSCTYHLVLCHISPLA